MIRVEHVTKKFYTKDGEVVALEDISFDLPNKGFVALCGENGCGKTTILNLIATLMSDYEGKIFIDNLDVANNSDFVRSKLVSYVLQDEYFIDSINVIDTLFLEDADYNKIRSELDLFKISDKALKKPCQLSGGQRQRVSFLRGVLKEGESVIFFEPAGAFVVAIVRGEQHQQIREIDQQTDGDRHQNVAPHYAVFGCVFDHFE